MPIFEDIAVEYNGEKRTIQSNQVMRLIARVEDVISIKRLVKGIEDGDPPMGKVAIAYAMMLRYAGISVTDEEIYCELFGNSGAASMALDSAMGLLSLMVPPEKLVKDDKKKADQTNQEAS
jgi:hypothetical protein